MAADPIAPPPTLEQRQLRTQTIGILMLCTLAVGFVLYWLRPVMIPFVLAIFVAVTVSPVIDAMTRIRVPRSLAVLIVLAVIGLVLNLLTGVVLASLQELTENALSYQQQLRLLADRIEASLPYELLGLDESVTYTPFDLMPQGTVSGVIVGLTNSLLDFLSSGTLVLIFVFFMLLGGATPTSELSPVRGELERQVRRYIFTKTILSAATGIAVGGVLMAFGVDLAVVFGLLTFLLNFIPSIGSIIATLLPLPVVLMSPEISPTASVLAIAIPGAIQFLIGNLIDPMVMGDSLDLHPVTILLSLMIWGALWGIVGMLLATPITAIGKLLLERSETGRPLAAIMAGRIDLLWSRAESGVP